MASYFNVFGGDPVQAANVNYNTLSFTEADTTTSLTWPPNLNTANVIANWIDVNAEGGATGCIITMPDATEASVGAYAIINNVGAESFQVQTLNGNSLINPIDTGLAYVVLLYDNSTPDGLWRILQYGAGTSSADAAALVGQGITTLPSLNNGLNAELLVNPINSALSTYTALTTDRAKMLLWTGGNGSIILPVASATSIGNGYIVGIKNGTDTANASIVTVFPQGSSTIDETYTTINGFVFAPGESAYFISDGTNWWSLGYGVNESFQISVLRLTLISSGIVLTDDQATNLIHLFTNNTINSTVSYPLLPNQYYISNLAASTFTVTVQCAGVPTESWILYPGDAASFYCDGLNMWRVPTSFQAGTATNPGMAFDNDFDSGLYYVPAGSGGPYVGVSVSSSPVLTLSATLGTFSIPAQINVPSGGGLGLTIIQTGLGNPTTSGLEVVANSGSSTPEPIIQFTTSRGTTTTYAPVQSNDFLGVLVASGNYNAGGSVIYSASSYIAIEALQAFTSVNCGTSFVVTLNPINTNTPTVALTLTTASATFTGKLNLPAGAANAPSLYFNGVTTAGLYSSTSGTIGICSGTNTYTFSATLATFSLKLQLPNGGLGTGLPSLIFANSANSGLYSPSTDVIGISANATAYTFSSTLATFSGKLSLPAGTSSAPSLYFSTLTGSGLYSSTSNVIGISASGSTYTFSSSLATFSQFLSLPAGSSTTPSLYFSTHTGSGLYSSTTDVIGISGGGTAYTFSSAIATFGGVLQLPNTAGMPLQPSLYFALSAASGLYSPASDVVGIVAAGSATYTFSQTLATFSGKLVLPVGAVNIPSLYFLGTATAGLYSPAAGTVGICSGTTAYTFSATQAIFAGVYTFNTTQAVFAATLQLPAGTSGAPSLTFPASAVSGLYSPSQDVIVMEMNGNAFTFSGASASTVFLDLPMGTTSFPSLTFGTSAFGFYATTSLIGISQATNPVVTFRYSLTSPTIASHTPGTNNIPHVILYAPNAANSQYTNILQFNTAGGTLASPAAMPVASNLALISSIGSTSSSGTANGPSITFATTEAWSTSPARNGSSMYFTVYEQGIATPSAAIAIWLQANTTAGAQVGIATVPSTPAAVLQSGSNAVYLPSSTVWINASDARIKTNIHDVEDALSLIKKLKPRKYQFIQEVVDWHKKASFDDTSPISVDVLYYGYVAQEVIKELPESKIEMFTTIGEHEDLVTYDMHIIHVVMHKALIELAIEFEKYTSEMEKENVMLKSRLDAIEAKLAA